MTERDFYPIIICMDSEEKILSPGVDVLHSDSYNNRLVVEGFVDGNPGRVFTVAEMVEELPFYVSPETCHYILVRCGNIERLTAGRKTVRYKSKAPELIQSYHGKTETDCLGEEARADYYDLVSKRSLCIKKRFKVIHRF